MYKVSLPLLMEVITRYRLIIGLIVMVAWFGENVYDLSKSWAAEDYIAPNVRMILLTGKTLGNKNLNLQALTKVQHLSPIRETGDLRSAHTAGMQIIPLLLPLDHCFKSVVAKRAIRLRMWAISQVYPKRLITIHQRLVLAPTTLLGF